MLNVAYIVGYKITEPDIYCVAVECYKNDRFIYAWHSTEKKLCQPKEVIVNAFIYLSLGQPLQGATKADVPNKHNKPRSGQ